ncbi:Peptidase family M1 [Seinonella peptonophila]|uniref:Peptidase family M1 n=1 Tax=Seinonella peptonophila TaxID=112248 RepID=A0A1M4W7C0_9BACL|nr:M1 family metallopeptidase [Seinonella peptonophila]SHE77045.1 Peptidase family M1 [Seinonella peptonophila]
MVDGKSVTPTIKTTAMVIPNLQLRPHSNHRVTMNFELSIPNVEDRLGWSKTTVSLGNWFPILAVYDQEGWNLDPYVSMGESFYSLTGRFLVTFTTSPKQVIATTGTEVGQPIIRQGKAIHTYQANQVRDFAMELDSTYRKISQKVGSINVQTFYQPAYSKFATDMQRAAIQSLQLFQQKIGPYPWPELDVVTMKGSFGGMEYPQLVMISMRKKSTVARIRTVVAHEVAHQWFYGQIGNNQYDDPWLDESFASYYESMFDQKLNELNAKPVADSRFHLSSPMSVFTQNGKQLDRIYVQMIYKYGPRTLHDLEKKIGSETFEKGIKTYFQQKQFDITTTSDFIQIMEQISHQNLDTFFRQHRVFIES